MDKNVISKMKLQIKYDRQEDRRRLLPGLDRIYILEVNDNRIEFEAGYEKLKVGKYPIKLKWRR
jgi:hypothetical protein